MKIPAFPLLLPALFLLAGLGACAGDKRLAEQAERLTVEEETVALAAAPSLAPASFAPPSPSPGRAALAGEVGVAPVAIRPGSSPLEAEAVEGGLRRSLERADLLAEDGGLLSAPDPAYRLALNIESLDMTGGEGAAASMAALSVRYILLDRGGRVVWSERVDAAGTAPAGSSAPARDAAEEAMRQSIRRMLGSLDPGA